MRIVRLLMLANFPHEKFPFGPNGYTITIIAFCGRLFTLRNFLQVDICGSGNLDS